MKTLFTTSDVHPRDRFDYWHSVACANLVDHTSEPGSRQEFRAEFQAGSIADIRVLAFENTPMTIAHTAQHAENTSTEDLFVCRQLAGRLTLEQNSREVVLEPGDVTLLDPCLAYSGRFFAGSRMLAIKLPRRRMEARVGKIRELTTHRITSSTAENRLASAFLAMLPAHTDGLDRLAAEIVAEQVLDLIAVSLATTMVGQPPRVSSARSLVRMKLHAAIEARLIDPALDAGTVAAAAGVSVRYANAVLSDENTSIMRLILAKRLAHCRSALNDALQTRRTVSEIAYAWGFSDMTHFCRTFRAAYGCSPSEYRRHGARSDGSKD